VSVAPPGGYEAVVVGSGFGGSIAALRLAQAGRSVLVLERGRRYLPGAFPRDPRDLPRVLWDHPRRPERRGLFDLRFNSGLATLTAAGVGGGSLIYAGIHIRPDAWVFEDPRWPPAITRAALDPCFDRVAAALSLAPLPPAQAVRKRDAFRAVAAGLRREVFDPDEAITWPGAWPAAGGCRLVAECEFGCQHGAKNTLDRTYLAEAERLGATVRAGALVRHLEPAGAGYRVHYADVASGTRASVSAARVVLAAGTLGTNEILLRSRDLARTLPRLSTALGRGFSGNGDLIGSVSGCAAPLEPWHGPDVTSVMRWTDAAPEFTLAAPTFSRAVMAALAAAPEPPAFLRPLAPLLWPALGRLVPWALGRGLLGRPGRAPRRRRGAEPERLTFLFAIGRDDAGGVLRLRRGRLDVEWRYAARNRALTARQRAAMREVAGLYGGRFAEIFTWSAFGRPFSVHPLGGCALSESPRDGVVSVDGEAHGHPGLFVADGSVVPTSIGFHPAMTIAGLSERIADAAVASFPA
jgi:cholesterol oxidase